MSHNTVCRFVLPALLWIATVIIEDFAKHSESDLVIDVHSISMECHSINVGTKVLNLQPNNLESSVIPMKMSITYN